MQVSKLSNGLEVVSKTNKDTKLCCAMVYVKAGSMQDYNYKGGPSHFLEHLFVVGKSDTKNKTAKEMKQEIEELSSLSNGVTNPHHVYYFQEVLKDDLETAVSLLAESIQNSVITDEGVDKERNVILQEYERFQKIINKKFFWLVRLDILKNNKLGSNTNLGTKEDISSMNADVLKRFYKDFYTNDNIVLFFEGNIEHDEAVKLTEKYFTSLPEKKKVWDTPEIKINYDDLVINQPDDKQVKIAVDFISNKETLDISDKQDLEFKLISMILRKRFMDNVRRDKSLVYSVGIRYSSEKLFSSLSIETDISADNIELYLNCLKEELDRIKTEPIPQKELSLVKKRFLVENEYSKKQSNKGFREFISYINIGKIPDADKSFKIIEQISDRDILNAANEILNYKYKISAMGNLNKLPNIKLGIKS